MLYTALLIAGGSEGGRLPEWAPLWWQRPGATLLAITVLLVVGWLEGRLAKPKTLPDRRVLYVGWVYRTLAVLPAALFLTVFVYLVVCGVGRWLVYPASFAVALVTCLIALDAFVRRVAYSRNEISFRSLFTFRGAVVIPWSSVQRIRRDFGKITILSDVGRIGIHTCLRGWYAFLEYAAQLRPDLKIDDGTGAASFPSGNGGD